MSTGQLKRLLGVWVTGKLGIVFLAWFTSLLVIPFNDQLDLFYSTEPSSRLNRFLRAAVKPLIRWDAVHFLDITINGYTREKQFAFLPLFPRISRWMVDHLLYNVEVVTREALGMLVVSNMAHLLGSFILYDLTRHLFNDPAFAYLSAAFFALNPSLIHMTAGYSEALCACLALAGLSLFYRRVNLLAAICWSLASATRANAVLLSGFFIFRLLHNFSLIHSMQTVFYVLLGTNGFMLHLLSGYKQFCLGIAKRPWCHTVCPNIYSFVQKEYWNIGLFHYYRFNQLPNFIIAAPIIAFSVQTIYTYARSNPHLFWSIGFIRKHKSSTPFLRTRILPHIYLLLVMLLSTLLVAHVQIITRLFTFMPIIYWSLAHHLMMMSKDTRSKFIMGMGCYSVANAVLFSAFYPPA